MLNPSQLGRRLRWRTKLGTVATNAKRLARVGNYWYWLEDPELEDGIDIASIVSPLRYDVLVRQHFFFFYAAHRDLYRFGLDTFVDCVRQSSYYTWYEKSETVRCRPHLIGDHEGIQALFVKQIHEAVALYEGLMNNGFDVRFPIVLRTAEKLLPPTADRSAPPTGKIVSGRYFLADGCHRLAVLMSLGNTVLPAHYFRVQCFREFSPFDSTSLLAHSLPIEPSSYFAFLSSRYCAPFVFEHRDDFLEHIRVHKPEVLDEVLSLIRVDGFDGDISSANDRS